MRGTIGRYALLDTGFWIGLFDPTDSHHAAARKLYEEQLERMHAVAPWPCLYEFMQTKFVKRQAQVASLRAALGQPGVHHVDDNPYRALALSQCLQDQRRPMSLVDRVLRAIIDDPDVRVDVVVTVDAKDFHDVCTRRRIELLELR
jgi:predicted nucleic acid-binding protein